MQCKKFTFSSTYIDCRMQIAFACKYYVIIVFCISLQPYIYTQIIVCIRPTQNGQLFAKISTSLTALCTFNMIKKDFSTTLFESAKFEFQLNAWPTFKTNSKTSMSTSKKLCGIFFFFFFEKNHVNVFVQVSSI